MSWSKTIICPTAEASKRITVWAEMEAANTYHTPAVKEVILSHARVGIEIADANLGKSLYFETSGSSSTGYADSILKVRVDHG